MPGTRPIKRRPVSINSGADVKPHVPNKQMGHLMVSGYKRVRWEDKVSNIGDRRGMEGFIGDKKDNVGVTVKYNGSNKLTSTSESDR
ncbi:jg16481 [Pararge aegeria aegeria]|uniref:Jg16481 protein n=1 Tax=Pararge aegeria aegeria TaxID=348720 RepID=A0A8S4RHC8_9NEOP|nr:jg16481 [Pararge aegeria aegeria]